MSITCPITTDLCVLTGEMAGNGFYINDSASIWGHKKDNIGTLNI